MATNLQKEKDKEQRAKDREQQLRGKQQEQEVKSWGLGADLLEKILDDEESDEEIEGALSIPRRGPTVEPAPRSQLGDADGVWRLPPDGSGATSTAGTGFGKAPSSFSIAELEKQSKKLAGAPALSKDLKEQTQQLIKTHEQRGSTPWNTFRRMMSWYGAHEQLELRS